MFLDNNGELEEILDQDEPNQTEYLRPVDNIDPLKKHLIDTIAQYERLIRNDDFKDLAERDTAHKLVSSLRQQLKEYEQRKTQTMKGSLAVTQYKPPSKEELREKGLKEIFHFYARQHIPHGIAFEDLEIIMNQVDLGEFTSFCKDFKVPLSRTDIKRAFNQCSVNHKPLEFEQFYKGILRLGVEVNNDKIEKLKKRLKLLPSQAPKKTPTVKETKKRASKPAKTEKTESEGEDSEDDEESEGEGTI